MSDEHEVHATEAPEAGAKPVRATSRARRIGGAARSPAPAPAAESDTELDAEATVERSAVKLDKPPARGKAPKPPAPDIPARNGDDDDNDDGRPAPAPMWVPALIALVGTAAAVVFIVLGVIASSGVWWGNTTAVRDNRGAVLAAAKSCMATMNTYDYRKLDQAEHAGLACTTGTLTSQYRTAFEKVVKPKAGTLKFTQTAQILDAGIETVSKDGSQWTVLVFGQLSTTNSATGTKTPRLDLFSARAVMQQAGGTWKIANYEYAPRSG